MLIGAAIITTSDSRAPETDISGRLLIGLLEGIGVKVVEHMVVTDELDSIRESLLVASQRNDVKLILTTGGTGLGPRDNTPEATRSVIEREAPGIAEAMRRESAKKTPMAMLSRGIAGVRERTLIVNLPGSPKAVAECFEVIAPVLEHAVRIASGDTEH